MAGGSGFFTSYDSNSQEFTENATHYSNYEREGERENCVCERERERETYECGRDIKRGRYALYAEREREREREKERERKIVREGWRKIFVYFM